MIGVLKELRSFNLISVKPTASSKPGPSPQPGIRSSTSTAYAIGLRSKPKRSFYSVGYL